jgi:hypothetical protein
MYKIIDRKNKRNGKKDKNIGREKILQKVFKINSIKLKKK